MRQRFVVRGEFANSGMSPGEFARQSFLILLLVGGQAKAVSGFLNSADVYIYRESTLSKVICRVLIDEKLLTRCETSFSHVICIRAGHDQP